MAKDKDRAQNPAAQQRKLEKQKALKKGSSSTLPITLSTFPTFTNRIY